MIWRIDKDRRWKLSDYDCSIWESYHAETVTSSSGYVESFPVENPFLENVENARNIPLEM